MGNLNNYLGFFQDLGKFMEENHKDICFYGYGSCFSHTRESPSDLDGGFIFPELITDKEEILDISKKIKNTSNKRKINHEEIQFSLIDSQTGRDGRFLSYDKSYTCYLKNKGEIISGPNKLQKFQDLENKFGELGSLAFNFRRIRKDFLMAYSYLGSKEVIEKIEKAKSLLKILPRKLYSIKILSSENPNKYDKLSSYLYNNSKRDSTEQLSKEYNSIDLCFFNSLNKDIPQNKGSQIKLWSEILTAYEEITKEYIEKNPPKTLEVKTII